MGGERERRWSRLNVIFGIARFLVALVALCLAFVVGYTGNAGFRAWVDLVVAPMGSVTASLLGVFSAIVLNVLASVLWGALTHRARQSEWRDRWRKWRRERYLRALVWLSGPVAADLRVRLQPAALAQRLQDLEAELRGLEVNALRVLLLALGALDTGSAQPCWVDACQAIRPPTDHGMDDLDNACNKLLIRGMLSEYHIDHYNGGALVSLPAWIGEANTTEQVSRLVREELKRRGL